VVGLATVFGAGGGTSSYEEIEQTDCILLWGSNAREAHPIFFHHLIKGIRNGAKMYAVDPRRTSSAKWADMWLGLEVGSDIVLANAIGREIIAAGLANREFIERATEGFAAYQSHVESYTLAYAETITKIPAEAIREVAHAYAKAPTAQIVDIGHYRACHRQRQRLLAVQPFVAYRPCWPVGLWISSSTGPKQCAGRRRHGFTAQQAPGVR